MVSGGKSQLLRGWFHMMAEVKTIVNFLENLLFIPKEKKHFLVDFHHPSAPRQLT